MELQTASTTSANLYKVQLDNAINSYVAKNQQILSGFVVPTAVPTGVIEMIDVIQKEKDDLQRLKSQTPQTLSFDALNEINKYYSQQDANEQARKQSLIQQAENEKAAREKKYQDDVTAAQQYNSGLLEPIKKKHASILKYKDKLQSVFDHYGITPLDISLSDNLTLKEFEILVDSAIDVCQRYETKQGKIFPLVTKPLKDNPNLMFTLLYMLALMLVCYFAAPFAAIPVFVIFCRSLHGMYQNFQQLQIASALMAQIDYQRFVPEDATKFVAEVTMDDIYEKLEKDLTTIKDFSAERQEALQAVRGDTSIAARCEEAVRSCRQKHAERVQQIQDYLNKVQEAYNKYLEEHPSFPCEQKNCLCMCHDFVLSKTRGTIDIVTTLPFQNFVFDSKDRDAAIKRIKLMLANTLLNVQVKQLTVEIYDPITMCADFTEFLTKDTEKYVKPNSVNLDTLMNTYRKYAQENVIALHGKTIDEFNIDAEKRELPPVEYKLLILISGFEGLSTDEKKKKEFDAFFDYSMKNGVWMWILDDHKRPDSVFIDGTNHNGGEPIQYEWEIGDKTTMIYSQALDKFKDRGIDYVTKYGDKFIPRSKWWTWDTIHEIYMPIGLMDGDPTKGLNVAPAVGDANVHSLLAGATGAGKSAAINEMLMSLITMYPPSELQLVYVDFKNVEAAKFTRGYDKNVNDWIDPKVEAKMKKDEVYYTRLSRIPHLYIISGTTDGEYALSIFNYLMDEMARRQKIINKAGVTKLEELRKQLLSRYNSEHNCKKTWHEMRMTDWDWYQENVIDAYGGDLPRLLIVLDEFQVMFNPEFVDQRIIDQINGKITAITKLARAMGCHFWFTSQSMKGTMSADTMSNFSLRMALRCSAEVSTEIIGNPASGTIKAKFGYMYSNDSAGQDASANRLWRVPFLDEKNMKDYIDPLYEMLDQMHEKHNMAEFYDEKILVPSTVLDEWYDNYSSFDDPRTFILGERAGFSEVKAPMNLSLKVDDGEGIVISAFERDDLMNLTLTMLNNIKHKGDKATLILNCMDKDTYAAMNLDEYVNPRFKDLAMPDVNVDEFVDALRAQVDMRKERGLTAKPLYVVLIMWEKCPGIGVDNAYKISDKFKAVVRDAASAGVHFIMAFREKGEIPRAVTNQLKHKFCGLLMSDQAMFFMNTNKAEKLPAKTADKGVFAIYEHGTDVEKVRVYQHPLKSVGASGVTVLEARAM